MASSSDAEASAEWTSESSGDESAPAAAGGRSGGEAESESEIESESEGESEGEGEGDASTSEAEASAGDEGAEGVTSESSQPESPPPVRRSGRRSNRSIKLGEPSDTSVGWQSESPPPARRSGSTKSGEPSDTSEGWQPRPRPRKRKPKRLPHVPGLTIRGFPRESRSKPTLTGFRGVRRTVKRNGLQIFIAQLVSSFSAETNAMDWVRTYYRAPEPAARAYDRAQLAVFGSRAITNFPAEQYPPEARVQRPAEVPQLIEQLQAEAAQHRREHEQQHPDAPGAGRLRLAGQHAPRTSRSAAPKRPVVVALPGRRIRRFKLGKRKRRPGPHCGVCTACTLRWGPCLAPALAGTLGSLEANAWRRHRVQRMELQQRRQLIADAGLLEGTAGAQGGWKAAARRFAPFGPPERERMALIHLKPDPPATTALTTGDYYDELLAVERARRRGRTHAEKQPRRPAACAFCGLRSHTSARCPLAGHLVDERECCEDPAPPPRRPLPNEAQPGREPPPAAAAEAREWLEVLPPQLQPAAQALGEVSRRHEAFEGHRKLAVLRWHGLRPPGLAAFTLLAEQLLAADAPGG